ncbi:hypothetical protein [Duganella sp. CF517]|uniref:hypothetical protein n=1 Tax=Duganella sp. CF517 TaxID=1881038 RepID=UPI001160DC8D|nr:hypothetical protein [Duganella sp. CF517]
MSAPKPANPGADTPSQSTPNGQPVPTSMPALVSLVVLLAAIALTVWVGKDLYAIVVEGEICRPRYRCQTWSSNPVSLGVQCLGFTLLMTIFVGLAYGALKLLMGSANDDPA